MPQIGRLPLQKLRPHHVIALLAVRWRDIDWDHGRLVVRQALDLPAQDGTPRFKETKTHRADRPLSLPAQLVDEPRDYRLRQINQRLASPVWDDLGLVVTNDVGRSLSGVTLRKHLYRVLDEAAISTISWSICWAPSRTVAPSRSPGVGTGAVGGMTWYRAFTA